MERCRKLWTYSIQLGYSMSTIVKCDKKW